MGSSGVNPLARMILSRGAALAVYGIYWWMMNRRHRVGTTIWARSPAESRLRVGALGFRRLFVSWVMAFTVYAFIIEEDGVPFTYYWLQECILKWDWIGVTVIAFALSLAEGVLAKLRLERDTVPAK